MHSAKRNNVRLSLLRLAAAGLSAPRAVQSTTGDPRRVLLLRPDHIGDVLLTAPAVALLRSSMPHARLTYVVGPWSVEAARHGPPVDTLQTIAFPGFTRRANANLVAPYAVLLREAARLRRERYDLALVLRPDHWWGALLALAAGIPLRVGGRSPETTPLLTHSRQAPPGQHAADQSLDLARLALSACGLAPGAPGVVPAFRLSEPARATAAGIWKHLQLDASRVVGIHPNAGAALKSWPVDCWARLADGLVREGRAVMLIGAPDDGPLLAAIQSHMVEAPASTAVGQALGISAAIYQRCAVVVTVDSGAGHLAAAVGTPTVRLYGPAPSAVFGPWPMTADQRVLVTSELACVACGFLEAPPCGATTLPACLLAHGVDEVRKAVEQQLARD